MHSAAVHRPGDERGEAAEEEAAFGKVRLRSYVHFFGRARLLTPEHALLAHPPILRFLLATAH